jgi:undecaprenyl-diphosphatase
MDAWLLNAIQRMACPPLNSFFKGVTFLGNGGLIWLLLIFCLFAYRQTRPTARIVLVSLLAAALITNLGLKPTVARARPYLVHHFAIIIAAPMGTSFPSGHASASFATAWACFRLYHKRCPRCCAALLVLAGAIAFSRLYLYVHYPSDVLVGALLGVAVAEICVRLAARDPFSHKKDVPGF